MPSLRTTYMGVELRNPVIAGASSMTSNVTTVKALERAGAGAIVISSLFEEQIQLEGFKLEEDLTEYDNLHPEMITVFPKLEHAGPEEHLMWVRRAKEAVTIPVFASLNAVNPDTWVEYAQLLEQTGVDGLELNFYAVPTDFDRDAATVEAEQAATVRAVKEAVSIPIAVKLSSYYTNPLHFIARLDSEGVGALVLFNRFFQPTIDVNDERHVSRLRLSPDGEYGLPLRFAGLLHGRIKADVCASSSIFGGEDVVRMLLAGATCVQVVSTLYKNRIPQMAALVEFLQGWMAAKGYETVDDFRGKLSYGRGSDRWAYTRAQYVKLLLKPELLQRHRVR
jgi:dihydroorotate dehydrogenase (fumarate)